MIGKVNGAAKTEYDNYIDPLMTQQATDIHDLTTAISADYSGWGSIPVSQYHPAGAQYHSITPNFERLMLANFARLVLGCIEAEFASKI